MDGDKYLEGACLGKEAHLVHRGDNAVNHLALVWSADDRHVDDFESGKAGPVCPDHTLADVVDLVDCENVAVSAIACPFYLESEEERDNG